MWHGHDPDVRVPLILKTFHGAHALPYETIFEVLNARTRFGIRFKCDPDSAHALSRVGLRTEAPQGTIKLSLTVMYASDGAVLQKVYTFNAYRPTDWRFVAEPVVWLGWRTHTRLTMRLSPCGGDAWQMTIDVDSMDLRPNSTDTMLKVLADNVTGRFGGGPPPMEGSQVPMM